MTSNTSKKAKLNTQSSGCARTVPDDTGVGLTCNRSTITKVEVTGGFGLEVKSSGKESPLIFSMASVLSAVEAFLTAAHISYPDETGYNLSKRHPTVYHTNGLPLLGFEWNDKKARAQAQRSLSRILLNPPLCPEMEKCPKASISFDARGHVGWDTDCVAISPLVEDEQKEESDAEKEECKQS